MNLNNIVDDLSDLRNPTVFDHNLVQLGVLDQFIVFRDLFLCHPRVFFASSSAARIQVLGGGEKCDNYWVNVRSTPVQIPEAPHQVFASVLEDSLRHAVEIVKRGTMLRIPKTSIHHLAPDESFDAHDLVEPE